MKRLIICLFVLLTLLWALPVFGANPQTITRIRGASLNLTDIAAVRQLTLTYPATTWSLHSASSTYYYDTTGAQWRYWHGIQSTTNLTALPRAPFTLGLPYFYSISSTDLELWRGDPLNSDGIDTTVEAPYVGSMGHIHLIDSDEWARDKGEVADAGTIANTVSAAYRFSFDYGYDSSGAVWRYVDTLGAVSDNLALTLNWKTVAAVQLYFDGTALDMGRIGATGGVQTEVVNWPNSYDPGNALQHMNKKNTQPVLPEKETTATIGTAAVTCFASREIVRDPNWCLYFKNTDGADPMTDLDIEVSANGVDWIDLGWATHDALAAGASCVYCVSGNAYRYVRGRCSAADANQTSSEVHYTANKD